MPMFENCPEEAVRYERDFVNYWPDAVRHIYVVLLNQVGGINADDARITAGLCQISAMKEIRPPMQFNDQNDENMGKRHAFGDAIGAVKKYFVDYIRKKGNPPSLSDVLTNVKAEPKYACI